MPAYCAAQGVLQPSQNRADLSAQGIKAIPAPKVSEKTQAEEEGHKGGQQGPWLEVEAGGP